MNSQSGLPTAKQDFRKTQTLKLQGLVGQRQPQGQSSKTPKNQPMRPKSGNKNYEIGEPHLINVNTEAHLVADTIGPPSSLKFRKKTSAGQITTKFHAQKQTKMPFGKDAKEKPHDYLQENIKRMGSKMRTSQAVAEINKKVPANSKGTSTGQKSAQQIQRQQRVTGSSKSIRKEHENVSTTPNQLYFKQGVTNIRVRNSIESSGGFSQEPKVNNFMAATGGAGQIRKGGDDVYNPRSKRQQSRQASSAQSSTNSTNFVRYHTINTEPDDDQVIISQMTPSLQQQPEYSKRHSGQTRSVPRTQIDDQDEEPYIISSSKFQTLKANRQAQPLTQNTSPSRNSHRDILISNLLKQSTPQSLNRVNSANQREMTKPLLPSAPQPISSSNLSNLVQNFQRQNQNMRVSIQQVGIHITSLANSAYNLKKDYSVAAIGKNVFFQEISSSIQSINDLFNTVHFMILENDDKLTQIGASIEMLNHQLQQQENSDKVFEMEQQMNKLAKMHQTLQKQMFETTKENKRLSYECERAAARNISDDQKDDHFRDQLLDENRLLNQRIEDLQNQAQVLVDAPCSNCQKFSKQSQRFLTAMRTLQKSVNSKEQPAQGGGLKQAKQDFELQKKLLEGLIKETRQKYANTPVNEDSLQNMRIIEQLYESQIKNKSLKKDLKEQQEKLGAWKAKVQMMQNQIDEKDDQIKSMEEEQRVLNEESRQCIQRLEQQLLNSNQLLQDKDQDMQNMIIKPVTQSAIIQTSFVEQQNQTQSEQSNLQLKLEELMSENAQLEKQIKMQDGALNNLRLQNKALNTQQNDSNTKEKDLIEKKVASLENQISNMSKTHLSQLEEAKRSRESMQQQIKLEKDQNEILNKQFNDLQEVQTENKELKNNIATLQDNNQKSINKLEAQTSVLQIKTNLISELNDKLEKSQVEQDKLKQDHEQSVQLQQTQSQKITDLEQKVKNLQEAETKHQEEAKALTDDVNQAESMRTKHQQTLEKNRDLIHLLKEQLQKSVDKQKALENNNNQTGEIQKQKIELLQQEIQKLKRESERAKTLENQVKQLKVQFSEKMTNLSGKVDDLETDNDKKDDLINEANKALEELSDEKHDIMAKFKHLVQVYVHQVTQSVNQSSYKGDDSSLSLNVCFDQLQEALEKAQGQADQPVQDINIRAEITQEFEAEKSKVLRAADEAKSQLNQCFEKHQELPKQVDLFQQMFAQNHEEIQRQVRMLPLLQRKLANYKKKLQEKVHQNRELSKKLSEQMQEQSQKMVALAKKMSDVEMDAQKQIEKEKENANAKDAALVDLKNQISQIQKEKDEAVEKAKQQPPPVKEETKKKDSNSDDDSDSDDQDERIEELELENMELLAKLAKTERDLQDAREAQQELQKEVNEDDSNVEVKLDANLQEKFDEFKEKIEDLHRKIFKIKEEVLLKMQEIRECDDDPSYKNEEDINYMIDGEQDPSMEDSLQKQLDELRSEQKELLKDLYDLRIKVERNVELEDDKELQTMKDDLQFFTAENLELRMKIKALVKQNIEQKICMQELKKANPQTIVTNVSGIINNPITSQESSLMISKDRLNLFDDSVEMGDVTRAKPHQEAQQLISKLSINDNANTSRLELPDSSIQSVITTDDLSAPKLDFSVLNETQISHLQEQLLQQQENVTQFQQEMLDIVNQVRQNRTQIDTSSPSDSVDKKVADQSLSSDNSGKENYQDTLLHIKGTLVMYLKKTPIIDLNNEILLKVIFSMLEFTAQEINELLAVRQELPAYKIDKSSSKGKQQAKRAPNNLLSVQVNSNGNNSSRNQITDTLSQASARNGTVNTDNSVGNGGLSGTPFTPKAGGLKVLDAMRQSLNRTPQSQGKQSDTTSQPGGETGKEKVNKGLMGLFKRSQSKDVLQPSTQRSDKESDPKSRQIYDVKSQDKHPLSERRSIEDKIIPVEKYRDPNNNLEDTQF